MLNTRDGIGVWLERLTVAAVVLAAAALVYQAFWTPLPAGLKQASFSQFQKVADGLRRESDPSRREDLFRINGMEGDLRRLDARMPANARVFVLDMLGRENFVQIGYYRFLTYYLFPREVAISLEEPPNLHLDCVAGRSPAAVEEVRQAGYDFTLRFEPDRQNLHWERLGMLSMRPSETRPEPIPSGDGMIALLLPLAVAIVGSRVVRWLIGDLEGILSTGELLASGLAVGAFLLTQLTLGLRMAGARWERALVAIVMVGAVGEVVLLVRCWRPPRPQLKARWWWLLLIPTALIVWCRFRLAGLVGIRELDAVENWAFKAKILHCYAGNEMWTWFCNPALAYSHMDYPLLVPLLHALIYGALGHVNDFVIKFWNQWMLLLLAWAVLGAGRFPEKRPWLAGSVAVAVVLLPMTREYALKEGATIPMLFYTVLSSVQLAIGMVEQQVGRLRLGLLLLLATVMVKFEGMMLLAMWVVLLLLDRESRAVLWQPRRLGWAGLLGLAAWIPYVVFRLHGPAPHPESGWMSQLLTNAGTVFYLAPMTWAALVSRQFLNSEFAAWNSPDNQHAMWQGHWLGWQSLVDRTTHGAGWICVLLMVVAWYRGGRLRGMMFRLFLVFLVFATMISLVWSAVRSSPMDYDAALGVSDYSVGGRYLYPVLMAWFVAGIILLARILSREPTGMNEEGYTERMNPPTVGNIT